MRIYEIARESKLEQYVWGSLDYALQKGGYDEKFRCGHYDGKGKIRGESTLDIRNSDFHTNKAFRLAPCPAPRQNCYISPHEWSLYGAFIPVHAARKG